MLNLSLVRCGSNCVSPVPCACPCPVSLPLALCRGRRKQDAALATQSADCTLMSLWCMDPAVAFRDAVGKAHRCGQGMSARAHMHTGCRGCSPGAWSEWASCAYRCCLFVFCSASACASQGCQGFRDLGLRVYQGLRFRVETN